MRFFSSFRRRRHRSFARRAWLVATLCLVFSTALTVVPPPRDAAALDPGAWGTPLTWAGTGTVGTAVGTLLMAPTVVGGVGAGATIAAFPGATAAAAAGSFGAGFAIGYYGAKALCTISPEAPPGDAYAVVWNPSDWCGGGYEFEEFAPSGIGASDIGTGTWSSVTGFGTPRGAVTVSWDELADFGEGNRSFVLVLVDKDSVPLTSTGSNGSPVSSTCTAQPASVGSVVRVPLNSTTNELGCPGTTGNPNNSGVAAPPYRDGFATALISAPCPPATPATTYPLMDNCGFEPGDRFQIRARTGTQDITGTIYAQVPAAPQVNARGEQRRFRVDAQCWVGPSWTITSVTTYSDPYFASDPEPTVTSPCPEGSITKEYEIKSQRRLRDTGLSEGLVYEWEAPPEWNPTTNPEWEHQECVKVGTPCELKVDTDTLSPTVGECLWGDSVVLLSYCADAPAMTPIPEDEAVGTTDPDPDPDPDPEVPTCPDAPGCPSDTPPPGGEDPPEGGECFPSGWGWLNPVEWVLKPVKCALVWAFWDQDAADEIGSLWGDSAGPWVDTAVESGEGVEFTASVGECFTIPTSTAELCSSDVLDAPVPGSVATLFVAVWVFALLFELLGLFARITGG